MVCAKVFNLFYDLPILSIEDCANEDSVVNTDPSAATLFRADAPSAQLNATQRVLNQAPKRKCLLAIADASDYSDYLWSKVLECDGPLSFLVWRTDSNCYCVVVLTAYRLSASTLRDELNESRRS